MKKLILLVGLGLLSWLVPFVCSFFFYTKEGVLTIDIFLFKSIMIVVGSITASILIVFYFKKVSERFVKEGWLVGITWFLINILLDILILLPMSTMSLSDYFAQIGLRYLVIPVFGLSFGVLLKEKCE